MREFLHITGLDKLPLARFLTVQYVIWYLDQVYDWLVIFSI